MGYLSRRGLVWLTLAAWLALAGSGASVQAQRPQSGANRPAAFTAMLYNQPHNLSGALFQSSRWDPDGSDYDQWVWDNFTLPSPQTITEIHWRGGYDPAKFGSGGPVIDFRVAIYASIPAGTQPDFTNPPLLQVQTGGSASETAAGTFGGTAMYDYSFTLPTPFQAVAGTKYWLYVVAWQHGIPDWGFAVGSGGDGQYFRRVHTGGAGTVYQLVSGDIAFSLYGPITQFTWNLKQGWNLMGNPSSQPLSLGAIAAAFGSQVTQVYIYNCTAWQNSATLTEIPPGAGVWVQANGNASHSFPLSSLAPRSSCPSWSLAAVMPGDSQATLPGLGMAWALTYDPLTGWQQWGATLPLYTDTLPDLSVGQGIWVHP